MTDISQHNDIIFYNTPKGDVKIEIIFKEETFWLAQKRIAELFGVEVPASAQTIREARDIAIVRHELDAKTNDEGKVGEAHLYVLLFWNKYENGWKLIARQAVKRIG